MECFFCTKNIASFIYSADRVNATLAPELDATLIPDSQAKKLRCRELSKLHKVPQPELGFHFNVWRQRPWSELLYTVHLRQKWCMC